MDIRQLRYFLDIARTEHLTLSAKNLFVTQSTLSHGLRQLEDELGVRLFERMGRGLKLSQAGQTFRTFAGRALQEVEAGKMALADQTNLQAGRLTVGAVPSASLNTLVPASVAAFSKAYPNVNIVVHQLHVGPLEDRLFSGEVDVGVAFLPPLREDIEAEDLFLEKMQLIVGPGHQFADRRSMQLKELKNVSLALLTRAFATRCLIDDSMRKTKTDPIVKVEMESVDALIAICRSGEIASIIPERAARLAQGLRVIDLTKPQIVRGAAILWRRGSSRSAAAVEFSDILKRCAGVGAAAL